MLHMWCVPIVMCYTCVPLAMCSTYDVLWCVPPMMCSTLMCYTRDVFYSSSTCVLLGMCFILDKQFISTDAIMLCCYVNICQPVLWCVMSTCVMMCYITTTHPTTRLQTYVPHRRWNIIISVSLSVWTHCYPVTCNRNTID